jgi:uncharacterized membrane protein (DUF485 family)
MTTPVPQDDPALRRRNRRFAIVLGLVAVAVYVAFFVIKGMGEG